MPWRCVNRSGAGISCNMLSEYNKTISVEKRMSGIDVFKLISAKAADYFIAIFFPSNIICDIFKKINS